MSTHPSRADHVAAIVTAVSDRTPHNPDRWSVTADEAPARPVRPPYVVVYPIDGGSTNGTAADPDTDVWLPFQLTCVAASGDEARWLTDRAEAGLYDGTMTVPGRKVKRIAPESGNWTVKRDDDHQPPLFYCTPRYQLWTTPA